MSMRPRVLAEVPEQTVAVARAAFRKPTLAMRVRDELGEVFADGAFIDAFGIRGKPGISPGQLAMITVLQFAENLTDRQAADAVRGRIDWKYCLGLTLADPGFDFSVLSQFRARLVAHDLQGMAFEILLDRLVELGLVTARGRQRTDATHVVAAVRDLNRLEMVGETLRAALEALAAAAPQWLAGHVDAEMVKRYGARIDEWRLPKDQTGRQKLAVQTGRDGYRLLKAVADRRAPHWLREIPAVDVLRQVWIQQYTTSESGRVIWRDTDLHGLPPGRSRIISPYDTDARYSEKRGTSWEGYKVHISETCDNTPTDDGTTDPALPPNLITNVATTHAAVADSAMTMPIHTMLADRDLLPAEHLMDAGYPSTKSLLTCRTEHQVRLISPMRGDSSRHAREGSPYARDKFTIDFDQQRATCPQGHHSATWNPARQDGQDVIVVSFPLGACIVCPARTECTRSQQRRRQLTLRPRHLHEALRDARAEQQTDAWKQTYRTRAGIEGTIHQTTAVTGIRQARYVGLDKVALEHSFAATAVNLIRLYAWWTGTPINRTRTTHLSRLDLTLAA
ncbi:IS1182 family transposase [Dactylosporangium sp. NPDC005555]|uniref:IS1182 family transposase n=1 Tax=Dactylosporangium sp. NPDC005555 TaxID=3154889 RepID=UPI0033B05D34